MIDRQVAKLVLVSLHAPFGVDRRRMKGACHDNYEASGTVCFQSWLRGRERLVEKQSQPMRRTLWVSSSYYRHIRPRQPSPSGSRGEGRCLVLIHRLILALLRFRARLVDKSESQSPRNRWSIRAGKLMFGWFDISKTDSSTSRVYAKLAVTETAVTLLRSEAHGKGRRLQYGSPQPWEAGSLR